MRRTLSLVASTVALTALLAAGPQQDRQDLSHFIRFQTSNIQLTNGDNITIEEIHGTRDTIQVGGLYEIKGTYKLASHDRARLGVDITSNDPRHFPHMDTQTLTLDKGEGRFTVYMYMWCDGDPHVSFYPMDRGNSYAGVYFDTKNDAAH